MKVRDANEALQKGITVRIAAGMDDVDSNLRKMIKWKPEIGFPPCEPIYKDLRNKLNDAPFFSETYLYNLLGKEDARTLLAYMGEFARALGYDGLWEMQEQDDES